ncbi:ESX secretion-associated protein EspG [Amycolatopsis sp. H20-H5]|uniref:ESX secretion-associated protein EspG n=1 Tax=Amycolatopsis sp. H20-H5 TaxID=3046309 RepID=UPI002DBD0E6E|nr:ESX secretion-associated protein EspG [Amycolatopsis sp. H20-H5]MEC3978868.1 ESX secretion-associated protein EspG [Amycolatopsis sp. H20-H5]
MRDPDSGWIRLHAGEFFLLWSALGLGELPAALAVPHLGRTPAARAELVANADRALAERELGTVDRPARDLAALLRSVADGDLVLDLHAEGAGTPYRAIGVVGRHGAASVGVEGTEVWLGATRARNLVRTLLGALTREPAGEGIPANLRAADFEAACAEGEREGVAGFAEVLRYAGVRPPELAVVVRAVTHRRGGGRLGGAARGRENRWIRGANTVNWVDTPTGRYALRRSGDWVTVTPLDPSRLRSMAEELMGDIAG